MVFKKANILIGNRARVINHPNTIQGGGSLGSWLKKTSKKVGKLAKKVAKNPITKFVAKTYKKIGAPIVKTALKSLPGVGQFVDDIEKAGKDVLAGKDVRTIVANTAGNIVNDKLGDNMLSKVAGDKLSSIVAGNGLIMGSARMRKRILPVFVGGTLQSEKPDGNIMNNEVGSM